MSLQCECRAALLCFLALLVVVLTGGCKKQDNDTVMHLAHSNLLALWGCMEQFVC